MKPSDRQKCFSWNINSRTLEHVEGVLTLLKTAAMSFSRSVRSRKDTSVPDESNAGRSKADAVQRKRSKVPAGAICRWR